MATDYKYSTELQNRQRMKIDEMFSHVFSYPWIFSPIIMERVGDGNRANPDENAKTLFAGRDVLDIGCGNGYLEERLLAYRPRSIVAVDIDVDMINKTKERIENVKGLKGYGAGSIKLIRHDAKKVYFEDGWFDCVFILSALGELRNEDKNTDLQEELCKALERAKRVTSGGGLLFLEYEEGVVTDRKSVESWVRGNFRSYDRYSSAISPGFPTVIGKIPYNLLICAR